MIKTFFKAIAFSLLSLANVAKAETLHITDFGATPDDQTDDTVAIQAAFDTADVGDVVEFTPGAYRHNNQLFVRDATGIEIDGRGAVLLSTDQTKSALTIQDSTEIVIRSLDLEGVGTARAQSDKTCGILLYRTSGVEILSNRVHGFSGCGVMIQTSDTFLVQGNAVSETWADGIHMTNGSNLGTVQFNTVWDTGDDKIAVVSYKEKNPVPVTDILILGNSALDTGSHGPGKPAFHGRGLAVDGGSNVVIENNYVENTSSACLLVASSTAYNNWPVNNVTLRRNHLVGCNQGDVTHGAILLSAREVGPVTNVTIDGNSIVETVGAGSHIRISNFSTGISITNQNIVDEDASHLPWTFYRGSQVTQSGNRYNGVLLP